MGADTKRSLSTLRERSVSASASRVSVAKTALGRTLQVTELIATRANHI